MPVEVIGLKEALKASRTFQPQFEKDLRKQIQLALNPVIKQARGYVPTTIPGLSHWTGHQKGNTINRETSMFRKGRFPIFNSATVRKGIKAEIFKSRKNSRGFIGLVSIVNSSAAGAIMETAGTKNPNGQPWDPKNGSHDYSHSFNPNAGRHFIHSMPGEIKTANRNRGRLIYRAVAENQGKALNAILKALNINVERTVKAVSAAQTFKVAA